MLVGSNPASQISIKQRDLQDRAGEHLCRMVEMSLSIFFSSVCGPSFMRDLADALTARGHHRLH